MNHPVFVVAARRFLAPAVLAILAIVGTSSAAWASGRGDAPGASGAPNSGGPAKQATPMRAAAQPGSVHLTRFGSVGPRPSAAGRPMVGLARDSHGGGRTQAMSARMSGSTQRVSSSGGGRARAARPTLRTR
jgi:hypothetical protein